MYRFMPALCMTRKKYNISFYTLSFMISFWNVTLPWTIGLSDIFNHFTCAVFSHTSRIEA